MAMIIAFGDVETTGLDPAKGHRVIELALLLYRQNEAGEWTRHCDYVQRFNPDRSIDPKAQALHGITFSDVEKEPFFEDKIEDVKAYIQAADGFIAHNASFDVGFLCAEFERAKVEMPNVEVLDTLQANWATPHGKPPSLKELCFALNVEYDDSKAHAALYDTEVLAKCFFEGLKRGFFKLPEIKE